MDLCQWAAVFLSLGAGSENNLWFLGTAVADSSRQNILLAVCCQESLTSFGRMTSLLVLLQGADGGVWVTRPPELFVTQTNWVLRWWHWTTSFCMLEKLLLLGWPPSTLPLCSSTKSSWRGQSERKWLVRAAIFFCLKDDGVSCFGFAVMLYLPL